MLIKNKYEKSLFNRVLNFDLSNLDVTGIFTNYNTDLYSETFQAHISTDN